MRILQLLTVAGVAVSCRADASPAPILVGGSCEGCENVFVDRPAKLVASTRIAPANEPGEPLAIDGVVRDAANQPVAGVIVYAYHTNAQGQYPKAKTRHGALRGFALTGKDGAYHFDTIRPASYPKSDIPQHVHMHVIEPKCHYFIDDIVFTDDPMLTPAQRKSHEQRLGGSGVVTPARVEDPKTKTKTWRVTRDIKLGAGIKHHEKCG